MVAELSQSHDEVEVSGFVFIAFMVLLLSLILARYVVEKWRVVFLPEAAVHMIVGLVCGAIIEYGVPNNYSQLKSFDERFFFVVLLPPIIFQSGYNCKRRVFFRYFSAIACFALLGTLVSTAIVGGLIKAFANAGAFSTLSTPLTLAECMTFGSLISATDPVSTLAVFEQLHVEPSLHYILFGESVLNDGVAITLFRTFSSAVNDSSVGAGDGVALFFGILLGSVAIGVAFGCVSALLFKHLDLQHSRTLEISTLMISSYLPFLLAEMLEMSGIIAILFHGMTSKHYTHRNLQDDASRDSANFAFKALAHVFEAAVFLDMGLTVFQLRSGYDGVMVLVVIVACLLGRAAHVYPLSHVLNRCAMGRNANGVHRHESNIARQPPIPRAEQHMLCFAGLRGAIAYALASAFPGPHRDIFRTATMIVVMLSVILLGGTTRSMLSRLRIRVGVGVGGPELGLDKTNSDTAVVAEPLQQPHFVRAWQQFDSNVLCPLFTRSTQSAGEQVDDAHVRLASMADTPSETDVRCATATTNDGHRDDSVEPVRTSENPALQFDVTTRAMPSGSRC